MPGGIRVSRGRLRRPGASWSRRRPGDSDKGGHVGDALVEGCIAVFDDAYQVGEEVEAHELPEEANHARHRLQRRARQRSTDRRQHRSSDGHQVRLLRRPTGDRKLAGVAAALAGFFGIDVAVVRIGFLVLAVLGGSAVPLYATGWLLIPEEGAESSIGQELFNDLRQRWAPTSL